MPMFKKLTTNAHRKALKKSEKQRKKALKKQKKQTLNEKKKTKKKWILAIIILFFLCFSFYVVKDNHSIKVTKYTVTRSDIPEEFDGYRILQISDLKGFTFGEQQSRLVKKIKENEYDVIILTGDYLGDAESEDYYIITELIEEIKGDVPVYYILGDDDCTENDTLDSNKRCFTGSKDNKIAKALEDIGCIPIYPIATVEKDGASIYLTGITYYEKAFDKAGFDSDKCFSICVTHAPVNYNVTKRLASVNTLSQKEVDFDMVISGHTLGGNVRLPVFGALYTKEGGAFPDETYIYGIHQIQDGRTSIISSGLGRDEGSLLRLFNTPEIVIIELHSK